MADLEANISGSWRSLRARYRWSRALALLRSICIAELMFGSFVLGTALGPVPLRHIEVILGNAVAVTLGIAIFASTYRRSLGRGAMVVADVLEGSRRARRRILVFSDHLLIDDEIVIRSGMSAQLEGKVLWVRYPDPRFFGPVLREFQGDRTTLESLRTALGAAPEGAT